MRLLYFSHFILEFTGDLYITGKEIIDALKYTDNTNYSLSTTNTTNDITDIKTGTTPMTFDYTP